MSGRSVHTANVAKATIDPQIKTMLPIIITNERIKNPKSRIRVFRMSTSKKASMLKPFL